MTDRNRRRCRRRRRRRNIGEANVAWAVNAFFQGAVTTEDVITRECGEVRRVSVRDYFHILIFEEQERR